MRAHGRNWPFFPSVNLNSIVVTQPAPRSAVAHRVVGAAATTALVTLLSAIGFVVCSVALHTHGGQDDTYITYWPARCLAEHGQILNYNGVRLEQSSSLSLVVVLALLYKLLPLAMPTVGYLVSLSCGAATLVLGVRLARRMRIASPWSTAMLIGTVACFAYWSTSGMETSLTSASGLWMILAADRLRNKPSLRQLAGALAPFALYAAVRPESPWIIGGMCASLLAVTLLSWRPRRAIRPALLGFLRVLLMSAASVAALLVFRRAYFHAWLPNPAVMKMPGFDATEGVHYLWETFQWNGPWLVVVALVGFAALTVATLRAKDDIASAAMAGGVCFGHLAFAVAAGGDWMVGGRFLAPAIPTLVLVGLFGLNALMGDSKALTTTAALLAGCNMLAQLQFLHRGESEGRPLWSRPHAAELIGSNIAEAGFASVEAGNKLHLRDALTVRALLPIADAAVRTSNRTLWATTGQAGMIAYHLIAHHFGRIKLVDLWSLTTRDLYNCYPRGLKRGRLGTEHDVESYLDEAPRLARECGLPVPDIIFNECIGDSLARHLERSGYVVVYNQTGMVVDDGPGWLFPVKMGACGYVAVRKELADQLGLKPSRGGNPVRTTP